MLVLGVDVAWAGTRAEGTYTFGLGETVERTRFEPFLRAAEGRAASRPEE
jgi:hypothetical protein